MDSQSETIDQNTQSFQPVQIPQEPPYHLPFKVILIVLVFALGIVVGVYGYQWYQAGSEPVDVPVETGLSPVSTTATPTNNGNAGKWETYTDEEFGISFEYPASWDAGGSMSDPTGGLTISQSTLRMISISRILNSEDLTPRQWFQQKRETAYGDLMVEIGEVEIQENPVLIIGQPETCRTVPIIKAIVSHNDALFFFTYYEQDKSSTRSSAIELGRLLETLSFDGQQTETTVIPSSYLQFPEPPEDISCSEFADGKSNYLHMTKYIEGNNPGKIHYVEGKDVVIEFPDYVIVNNEKPYSRRGYSIADAEVIVGDNHYFITNIDGWPGARWEKCTDDLSRARHDLGCFTEFKDGSAVGALWWVSDKRGVFLLNVHDIHIETYRIDNFSIRKGPLNLDAETFRDFFQGRFTQDEIDMWIELVQNVRTIQK